MTENKSSIVFKEANESDFVDISLFHGMKKSNLWHDEYCTWLKDKTVLAVARKDNKIIGTQAFIPYYININGQAILSGRSERTLLSPEYRGKLNFVNLMEFAVDCAKKRGINVFWGSTSAYKPFKNTNFNILSGYRCYFASAINLKSILIQFKYALKNKLLHPKSIINAISKRDRSKIIEYGKTIIVVFSSIYLFIKDLFIKVKIGNSKYKILNEPIKYEDISILFENIRENKNLIHLEQSEEFIKWILGNNNKIIKLFYYYNEHLLAYIYIDITKKSTASIMDFASEDKKSFNTLLYVARKILNKLGYSFIFVATNIINPHQKKLSIYFLLNGFIPFYKGGSWVIRYDFDNEYSKYLENISNWYITDLWLLLNN